MSVVPNRNEPTATGFRQRANSAAPPQPGDTDTGPTLRFGNLRQAPERRTREQRTRRTVDLSLTTHRALDAWQQEAADRLGVARVTGQEVFTALIDQLLTDPKLADQITRAIQARR
jgi:hypothetical protein